jgi:hypothetical protein
VVTGTNVFAQHLRRYWTDAFMLFAGAPIDQHRSRSFNVVGVQKRGDGNAEHRAVDTALRELCGLSTTCSPRTNRAQYNALPQGRASPAI